MLYRKLPSSSADVCIHARIRICDQTHHNRTHISIQPIIKPHFIRANTHVPTPKSLYKPKYPQAKLKLSFGYVKGSSRPPPTKLYISQSHVYTSPLSTPPIYQRTRTHPLYPLLPIPPCASFEPDENRWIIPGLSRPKAACIYTVVTGPTYYAPLPAFPQLLLIQHHNAVKRASHPRKSHKERICT